MEITVNGSSAAILYSALGQAIAVVEKQITLKQADMFRGALELQLAAYRAERDRLAGAFPTLSLVA